VCIAGGAFSACPTGLRKEVDDDEEEESVRVCLCVFAGEGVIVQVAGVG
jgi:hypothetical protein